MNDEQFEQRVRETARRIAGADRPAPTSLHARVASIPAEHPPHALRQRWLGGGLRLAGASLALIVVAAVAALLASTLPRNNAVVPGATGTPAASATPSETTLRFGDRLFAVPPGWHVVWPRIWTAPVGPRLFLSNAEIEDPCPTAFRQGTACQKPLAQLPANSILVTFGGGATLNLPNPTPVPIVQGAGGVCQELDGDRQEYVSFPGFGVGACLRGPDLAANEAAFQRLVLSLAAPPPSLPSVTPIPWIDASPAPLVTPSQTPVASVSLGTPDCAPGDLVAQAHYQGATGSMLGSVIVTNHGGRSCALSLVPVLRVIGSEAGPLPVEPSPYPPEPAASGQPTASPVPSAARLLLTPGASASALFQWFNWCGTRSIGDVSFRIVLSAGTLEAAVTGPRQPGQTPYALSEVPRCDFPSGRSTISIEPFQLLPPASASPSPDPLASLRASLSLPSTGIAGQALRYVVRLTNPGPQAVTLDPCPSYVEALAPPAGGLPAKEDHLLNCAAVGEIGAGSSVDFEMVLQVPAGEPAGSATVTWMLGVTGGSAEAAVKGGVTLAP